MRTIKSRASVAPNEPAVSIRPDMLESFIGTPAERKQAASRKKYKPSPGSRRKEYIAEVERRIAEQDWSDAKPGLLVALYWTCHLKVYGVAPVELDSATTWTTAMKASGNMVKFYFGGSVHQAIIFMRWLWTREQGREQWRRKQTTAPGRQEQGFRITWVRQFCRAESISDWKAAKVRHQG